jgi:tetratricopeptide (TPR) repeat protein
VPTEDQVGDRSKDGPRPAARRDAGRSRTSANARRQDGRSDRDRTAARRPDRRPDRRPADERTAAQRDYDGPPIPPDVTGDELDRYVKNQLRSLPEKLAQRVARHLVAAGRLLDTDPETAYAHTVAARARAARVAVVREASGEAAYAAGRFKDALAEFKAARRIGGEPLYLPMMADCERALGRPERAITMAKDPAVSQLDEAGQIEMRIVESGARRDRGEAAAAIGVLEGRELHSRTRADWSPRLRYAYAEALLADGRREQAREWFERAAGVDFNDVTDAADRVAELDAAR